MNNSILKHAVVHAALTAFYVVLISSCLFYAPTILGTDTPKETVLIPILMLLLLVVSAAITGSLVFGRPILWYLDGKKKEALILLAYTLSILVGVIFCILAVLYAVV